MKTQEQIIEKENRELMKWEKVKAKPTYKGYTLVMLMVIALVHLVDSIATDIGGQLQTSIVTEFFVTKMGLPFQKGLALFSTYTMAFILLNVLAPFYKALADKFGRKRLFIISVFGMAVGMVLCTWSPNVVVHMLGRAIIAFFIASDIQVIYILEVAPANKRGTMFSLTKFLGCLGIVIIPILRNMFMAQDSANWRSVFIFPALLCIVLTFLIMFTIKESDVFLDNRISYLKKPYEERHVKVNKKSQEQGKTGIGPALKYITKDKQLRAIWLTIFLFYLALAPFYNYYETIMSTSGMDTNQVTKALLIYPFIYAGLTLASGFIGDKLGRKKLECIYAVLALTGFIGFVISAKLGISPYIVGACFGLCIGSYWNAGDFLSIMFAESAPTAIRSSVMAVYGLTILFAAILSGIVVIIGMLFLDLTLVCGVIGGVAMALAIIFMLFKVKETNGVDLEKVTL